MRRSTLPALFLALATAGCDCGPGRLVSANGGALRVTLLDADRLSTVLQLDLVREGQTAETRLPIATLPLETRLDGLEPGTYLVRATAWDARPAPTGTAEVPEVAIARGGVTDVTFDLSRERATPAEACNGVDDDGDGEADEALDLPVCVACAAGATTVLDDDARCPAVRCDGLDTFEVRGDPSAAGTAACVKHPHALRPGGRCLGAGACAASNGPLCEEAAEQVVADKPLCQVLAGCEAGAPSLSWAPDGTPCGASQACVSGVCTPLDAGVPDAGGAADPAGCSDGTREGFQALATYPAIAACSGGWSLPGVTAATAPACNRVSGNTSGNRDGAGCASADLCAAGWHLCRGKDEVAARSGGSCADAVPPGTPNNTLFFAVVQASQSNTTCDTSGNNDVFGCGNLGTQLSAQKNCGVLTRALASTQAGRCGFNEAEPSHGPWQCLGGAPGDLNESAIVTKQGCSAGTCTWDGAPVGNADKGGVLCCRD